MSVLLFLLACSGKDDTAGEETAVAEDLDGDTYSFAQGDCDDSDAAVHPGAEETWYDGVDQDCDGNDQDQDRDGYTVEIDCADTDALVNPGATDVGCDGVDQDCDGADATDGGAVGYADTDGDTYGNAAAPVEYCDTLPAAVVLDATDCDDTRATAYPGAPETCNDLDDDCDFTVDEEAGDAPTWYYDADGDTFGDPWRETIGCDPPEGYVADATDCDDAAATTYPGAAETCDGTDESCDGTVDDGFPTTRWYQDTDADGHGDPAVPWDTCLTPEGWSLDALDCDDGAPEVSPDAIEACNGIDDDCDGQADESGATGESTWYLDADGDTYGVPETTMLACGLPSGYADNADDCDDADRTVSPGAAEADNLRDDDCDVLVDEDFLTEGVLVIAELAQEPLVGGTSGNTGAQWFEVYNPDASRTVVLDGMTVSAGGASLVVDSAAGLSVGPSGFAVFCASDAWEDDYDADFPLFCDYVWTGEAPYGASLAIPDLAATPGEGSLAIHAGAQVIDEVAWSWTEGSADPWPHTAGLTLRLDDDSRDAVLNDEAAYWCAAAMIEDRAWWVEGAVIDYGTPAGQNGSCLD